MYLGLLNIWLDKEIAIGVELLTIQVGTYNSRHLLGVVYDPLYYPRPRINIYLLFFKFRINIK